MLDSFRAQTLIKPASSGALGVKWGVPKPRKWAPRRLQLPHVPAVRLKFAGLNGFRLDLDLNGGLFPLLNSTTDLSALIEQGAPLQEQYDTARQILIQWGDGPDLVELVLLEPLSKD